MIEVKGYEKIYYPNIDKGNKILEYLNENNFWNDKYCTKEVVEKLIQLLSDYVDDIKEDEQEVLLRKHETENEARNYFGNGFINKFDDLMKNVDSQESVMAIHGGLVENLSKISKEGLYYKNPQLLSTACIQERSLDGYREYETLLNWPHKEYKGLTLLAIPYECFYKEPLWEKMDTNYISDRKYKIRPEFIIGYIDVVSKKIVMNPNYKREHDYSGLIFDTDIYHKRDVTNREFYDKPLYEPLSIDVEASNSIEFPDDTDYLGENMGEFGVYYSGKSIENINKIASGLSGVINSSINGYTEYMSEYLYESVLNNIKTALKYLSKDLSNLKTAEEARNEILSEEEKYKNMPVASPDEFDNWFIYDIDEEDTKGTSR